MASKQSVVVLPPQADLCPSPLHIRKKARRTTLYRRITRKSTSHRPTCGSARGPLDDIIHEITGNIWSVPFESTSGVSSRACESVNELLTWQHPLKTPPTCIVNPLPVSRIPSDQPLTIRKNRNSRSTGSGSSTGFPMPSSQKLSQERPASGGKTFSSSPIEESTSPWPLLETERTKTPPAPPVSTTSILTSDYTLAQKALQEVGTNNSSTSSGERRSSRLRLFTNNFSRLRRTGTGDSTEATVAVLARHDESEPNGSSDSDGPDPDAIVEAFMQSHARNPSVVGSVITQAAKRLPSSFEHRCEKEEAASTCDSELSTLKAAVRILPETKLLHTTEQQDLWVGVEVSGVLHNRHALADSSIDLVFVIDNSYYTSKDCLSRALNTVISSLYHLSVGDRVALYTTHCTHNTVSGTVPDTILPLSSFGVDTDGMVRELVKDIGACGTQTLEPPRPNPIMSDVVLAVVKSLESKEMRPGQTHVVLLTPTTNVLHAISKTFPQLYVHQLSPAMLPYRLNERHQGDICEKPCCENVFVSNRACYQSSTSRIKQIIRDARSERVHGRISNVHVDIRAKKGCEVMEIEGTSNIGRLRLGQVHSFFVRIRVYRSETQEINLSSKDPVFMSSLDDTLTQDLRNAQAMGATNAHLLSVQVLHQSSLAPPACWHYTEAQLVVTKDLGGLMHLGGLSLELFKRQCFHRFSKLDISAEYSQDELELIASVGPKTSEDMKQQLQRLAKELSWYKQILDYEVAFRQKLPSRPGPIDTAMPHEWLVEKWEAKKNKRKGLAII